MSGEDLSEAAMEQAVRTGLRRILALAAALMLAAPAPIMAQPAAAAPASFCAARGSRFVIAGHLDAAMAACVAERLPPTVTELLLSSDGGDVGAALDIADRLKGRDLTIRVVRECNSSCANYLVPMAARLVLEPGAMLLLHGGADPAFMLKIRMQRDSLIAKSRADGATAEEAEGRYRELISRTEANIARQRAFLQAQGIKPGWLIYRSADKPTTAQSLQGDSDPPLAQGRALIVEERLVRSCLPHVQVQPFQADLDRQLKDPRRKAWLRKLGAVRSATLHCP